MNFNLIEDILVNSVIANQELVSETIFVDENPAKVEIVTVSKVNSDIKRTVESKEFKLIHFSTNIDSNNISSAPDVISKSIDRILIETIKNTDDIEVIKYKNRKVLGLIKTYDVNKLLSTMNYFNWVIVPFSVFKQLSKIPNFEKYTQKKGIYKIGYHNNLTFFTSGDLEDDSVLIGMNDSITSVFLNDVYTNTKSNIYDIGIDYLFVTKGIRKLILE
jgi:hypothetical protein